MKFASGVGFSTLSDWMVWPQSLSRVRKWLSLTKCMHSQVVGLRLEVSLVLLLLLILMEPLATWCHCLNITEDITAVTFTELWFRDIFSANIINHFFAAFVEDSAAEAICFRWNVHPYTYPFVVHEHLSRCSISILCAFPPFYFSLSFIGFTYFLLLSIPSLSTRIVPLRFQAGGRRRRPNLGLVCVLLCNLCYLYSLVKMHFGVLFYLV